ncbi:hypothetical protein ETB97_004988 [Aspergillus alliaceus]|uniref:Uncharacterized protein n=1 Tax=Petromyces alliaceus TaxID=209559 RepID=A0A8H6A0T8_PETAA|nr:hypothetical protein ETB97_004988 [Aspergillus burnettii]
MFGTPNPSALDSLKNFLDRDEHGRDQTVETDQNAGELLAVELAKEGHLSLWACSELDRNTMCKPVRNKPTLGLVRSVLGSILHSDLEENKSSMSSWGHQEGQKASFF